jgi:hypothetical protein
MLTEWNRLGKNLLKNMKRFVIFGNFPAKNADFHVWVAKRISPERRSCKFAIRIDE